MGCKSLWAQVIFQAVTDAKSEDNSTPARLAKDTANNWILNGGKGFVMVCSMAGVDPDEVRRAYLEGRLNKVPLKGLKNNNNPTPKRSEQVGVLGGA